MTTTFSLFTTDISDLGLSTRVANLLKRHKIRTAADLASFSAEELVTINQMGEKGLHEVVAALGRLGYCLQKDLNGMSGSSAKISSMLRLITTKLTTKEIQSLKRILNQLT